MGCGSCGTGKPNGCKSNGGCSTGGCNRMNVHDWLVNLPVDDAESQCRIIEVSFKNGSRKDFFRNTTLQYFEKGDYVTVEGIGGYDVGEVSLSGELVRMQLKKRGMNELDPEIKKVLRPSTERDIESFGISKGREAKILSRSREIAIELKLQMKLSEIEIQADGKKATFFYTADDRVDFREMIKMFANEFRLKVEMKQIGIRQEAAKMGGIGSCGRELCCSTWLTDFKSVNTTAARYQNLSINQTKLSGQCGRLKCCLNFELDTYLDALQHFPDNADVLETAKGNAFLIKKDIFKNLMWYMLQGGSKHYPLSIQRAKEIKKLNSQGVKPTDLEPLDLSVGKNKDVEPEYADLVGQITLKPLEKNRRKDDRNRNADRPQGENRGGERGQQRPPQPRESRENSGQQPNRPAQPRENRDNAGQPQNRPTQPRENRDNAGQPQNRPAQPRRENNVPPQQKPPQNRNPQRPPQNNQPQPKRENGGQPQQRPQQQRPPQNRHPQRPQPPRENRNNGEPKQTGGDKPAE